MKKKLLKQKIAAILVCALITGTIGTNTAFASVSRKNITTDNVSLKASNNKEENSPELNEILEECKEIKAGKSLTELKRGERISVESAFRNSAIMSNGDLYCWGYNNHGQVGNDTTEDQLAPVKVLSDVKSVSYSSYDSMSAITTNGDLYCWGRNSNGQVGNGTTEDQIKPVKVLSNVESVFSSSYYSYDSMSAITTNGDLYCWGDNRYGQIGNGTTENQTTPVKVLSDVKSVVYSSYHAISNDYCSVAAVTEKGDLYCWGDNRYGQIGNGTTENQMTPIKVLSDVKSISAFSEYCMSAITEKGDLYCWGVNWNGQIGNGTTENQTTPVKILSDVNFISPSCYGSPVSVITTKGDLYCWGNNHYGQVGNGTTEDQTTPVKVLSDVKSISSRNFMFMSAITTKGDLYCWGVNWHGQVGNGTTEDQTIPVKVLSNVKSASPSVHFMSAITEKGDLYCWGSNNNGAVGNGTTEDQITPVKVLSDVKSVCTGSSMAITEKGDLYCWGSDSCSDTVQFTPFKVSFDDIIPQDALHITGTLNKVNIDNATVVIDNMEYSVTDNFDISAAYSIISGNGCKTVTAILSDNKVLKMDNVEDIVEPKVNVALDPHSISYQGNTFDKTQVKINVSLSCGAKFPYKDSDIKGTEAENISVNFSEYIIEIPEELEFQEAISSSLTFTDKIADTLKLGMTKDYTQTAYIRKDYILNKVKDTLSVSVIATGNGQRVSYNAALSVANLDKQSEIAENKNISEDITEAETLIDEITLAMDGDDYYDKEQLNAIESVVKVWITEMFVTQILTTDTEDNSIWADFCDEADFSSSEKKNFLTNIATKAFKKLGLNILPNIDYNTGIDWKNTEAKTVIKVYQKDGEKYDKVTINLQFDNPSFLENNEFTGLGKVDYTIQTPDKKIYTGTGSVTLTDLQTFSQCVKNICTNQIKQIFNMDIDENLDKGAEWIKKQINNTIENKIVEVLTSDTASKLLSKKFGKVYNNIFEIYKKEILKKTNGSVFCPVDVYIYDSHGDLCGSIVNNKVETDNGDIFLYCVGDDKYFSLTGDDYKIQFVGNDEGSMTYKIDEYCNLKLVRSIIYENVKLQKNKIYQGMIPQTQLLDSTIYNLVSMNDAEMVLPSSDIIIDNKIDIDSSPIPSPTPSSSGSISGGISISGGGISIVFTPTPLPTPVVTPTPTPIATSTPIVTPMPTSTSSVIVTPEPSISASPEIDSNNRSKKKIADSDVTLNKKLFVYNGKAKKAKVTIINGSSELIKDLDYTISYYNNINIGTATIIINGIGDYIGSIDTTFKIVPKGTSIKGKLKPKYKGFVVKWKKHSDLITSYQVQYSINKKFKNKKTVVETFKKKSVTKFKASKLKAGKKYYVRVRTYKIVKGKKYYSKWSKTKAVTTKK